MINLLLMVCCKTVGLCRGRTLAQDVMCLLAKDHLYMLIVCKWHRYPVSAVSAQGFIEAMSPGSRGNMEDKEHVGKMIVYLSIMLDALATRVRAMGVLTDGLHAALYVGNKSPDGTITFAKSLPLALNQGDRVCQQPGPWCMDVQH